MKSLLHTFCLVILLTLVVTNEIFAQDEPDYKGSFEFEGRIRNYEVYLPQGFQANMPLVISLHGYSETIKWYKDYTVLHEVADTMGFIIVYPAAINTAWNNGVVDPRRNFPDVDDVGFISTLIDTLFKNYEIDLKRVYACGYSTGGEMAFRLACDLGHRVAAVASVGGKMFDCPYEEVWQPIRPIPVIEIHGTEDKPFEPYYETRGTMWTVPQTIDFWIENNLCMLPGDTIALADIVPGDSCTVEKIIFVDNSGSNEVIHYKILNGGHSWPDSKTTFSSEGNKNLDINANVEILNFFKNH